MMTSQGRAWVGIGGLVALAGLGWLLGCAASPTALIVDNPHPVTRRRRRRKRAPGPGPDVRRAIADCERSTRREMRPQTFKRKREAVRALLDANPELMQLVESDCGTDCNAFAAWEKRDRRGPKPRARAGDGRFDALNERFERRTPGRKVASWREALAVTAPSSRRWEDFGGRVEVLEESTGLRLNAPERTEAIRRARELAQRCQDIEGASVEVIPF